MRSLSEDERRTLEALASKMLVSQMRGPDAVRWMCRMCDTGACRAEVGCPVTNVVRERSG